jgi:uncharacterized membrane protein
MSQASPRNAFLNATVDRMMKMAASGVDYKITARPNCSLPPAGKVRLLALIATISLLISIAFGFAGAWMVLPFAGLELLALAFAFYIIHCHAEDYESITIDGDRLAVERRDVHHVSQMEFHRYWVHVLLRMNQGGEQRLWLRSHGQEVEVGRYMSNEQRLALAQQLKKRTGAFYQR